MSIYGFTLQTAETYFRAAERKKMAIMGMGKILPLKRD